MIAQASAPQNNLRVDLHQIARQLELLNYKLGETVFLRAFYPSDDPRQRDDKGRKADATTIELMCQTAQRFQNEGRGIYFVVNGGGQRDAEVETCRAIFYEHDNLAKELQLGLWETLGLPEPTFQVDTGGKSIHSYWVLTEPIDPTRWRSLQTDLLEFSDGDRSLKNPSRVMRLAGCCHLSAKGAYPSLIVSESGIRYSYEELRSIVPQKKQAAPTQPLPLSTVGDVPLFNCLSKSDRELIESGVTEGGRNTQGAKLSRGIIGNASRLEHLGVQYSSTPRELFDEYCARCNPILDAKEADSIWRKAVTANPTATMSDDALMNCMKAWQKNQRKQSQNISNQNPNNSSAETRSNPNISELSLRDRIAEIIDRGLSSSSEKQALLELAKQTFTNPRDIDTLADLVRHEIERELYREETQKEVEQLIKARPPLNLADYLPKKLAEPVIQWCSWLNIRPEVALSAILVTASSLHETGTELIIHGPQGFTVPSTLFMALIAVSGPKKSPVHKNLIFKPLKKLKAEAKAKYEWDLRQYQIEYKEWKDDKSENKGEEPQKPVQTVFHFGAATGEGIQRLAQDSPKKPLFMLVDEIEAMLNSSDQYRGGRGSDRQDVLSYYDGAGQTTLRASGVKIDIEEVYLSIFGGIQPDKLKTRTKDLKDADGYWARFLFVHQPLAPGKLGDRMAGFDISELLGGYYRRVYGLGKRTYTLSDEAYKVYETVYLDLEDKRCSHPSPGMKNIYAKLEGQIGRLAINLHAMQEVEEDSCNERNGSRNDEISGSTMRKAIALANFYLGEVIDLHADSKADRGDIPALLAKLLEYANQKGSLTPRDAVTKFNAIKKSSEALDQFRELEVMGYGVVEKEKRNWVFIPGQDSRNDSRNDFLKLEPLPNQYSGSSRNDSRSSRNGSRNDFLNLEPLASEYSGSSRNERNDFLTPSKNTRDGQATEKNESKNIPEIITPLRSLREAPQPFVESGIEPRNGSRNAPPQTITRNDIKPELESDLSVETQNENLGCDTPIITSSVKSSDVVSKSESLGLGEWKVGDIANYCGENVSVCKVDGKDGLIMVLRQDGEVINAQRCELFRQDQDISTVPESEVIVKPPRLSDLLKQKHDITEFVGQLIEVRTDSGIFKFTGKMICYDEKNGFIVVMTEEGEKKDAYLFEAYVIG